MGTYYVDLAAREGLRARTVRALIEEVFASPTDARWRVLASVMNAARLDMTPGCEGWWACLDILAIIAVEREWGLSREAK